MMSKACLGVQFPEAAAYASEVTAQVHLSPTRIKRKVAEVPIFIASGRLGLRVPNLVSRINLCLIENRRSLVSVALTLT
jgi:hypothetical protein